MTKCNHNQFLPNLTLEDPLGSKSLPWRQQQPQPEIICFRVVRLFGVCTSVQANLVDPISQEHECFSSNCTNVPSDLRMNSLDIEGQGHCRLIWATPVKEKQVWSKPLTIGFSQSTLTFRGQYLKNALRDFYQICYKFTFGLEGEIVMIWWSNVTLNLTYFEVAIVGLPQTQTHPTVISLSAL